MTNKVRRELKRLKEVFDKKYEVAVMNISGSIDEFNSILPDDIQEALKYWFDVRIRKVEPTDSSKRKTTTSYMIKHDIAEDLGIPLSHSMIGSIMTGLIGRDNVMSSGPLWDQVFRFENVEIIPIEECAVIKIFIAQPMSGVPDEEVEKIRDQVTKSIIKKYGENIEIVDQFHVPEEDMPKESLERPGIHLLGRSIQFLADVDYVVFVGDFLHAKGCCVELAVCKEYGIPFEVYTTEASIAGVNSEKIETEFGSVTVDELGEIKNMYEMDLTRELNEKFDESVGRK